METLRQDLRYALRRMLKSPGYTAVIVVALALGIGVNTAIFSVADAFLLKPVPFLDADRLVMVLEKRPNAGDDWSSVANANYLDWKSQSQSFEHLAAYDGFDANITGGDHPEQVQGFLVTANFFEALAVKPAMGRTFLPEEDQRGHEQVVVLSHGLWERRFGSDPDLIGKTVSLNAKKCVVAGIMPKGFDFPMTTELWMPLAMDPKQRDIRDSHELEVVGRLNPGTSTLQARAEMEAIAGRLEQTYPQTNKGWGVWVKPIREHVTGDLTRQYTLMLLVAVAFVLLIACANVANVQFARATGRQKEIAVRLALGASRWRLVRQLLTESVMLSLLGGVLSLLLAQWSIGLILGHMPPDVARYIAGWKDISLDGRALLFTLAIAVLSGVISGFAPAIQSSRPDLNEALKESGRSSTGGRRRQRLRNALVIAEVSLALVLLTGAGLMAKSVYALVNVHKDYVPESLLTLRLKLPESKYKERHQMAAFYDQLLRGLESVPQVQAAAVITKVPFANGTVTSVFNIEGQAAPEKGELRSGMLQSVSPNLFSMLHIPLREGRILSDVDGPEAPRVVVISESLSRRYWSSESPIGKRIKLGRDDADSSWMTVVGIVGDVKYSWFDRGPQPTIYSAYQQAPLPYTYLSIRTSGEPTAIIPAVRSQIAGVDSEQPVFNVKTLERVISESVVGLSYVAVMMTILGLIALVLASVGVYGVMAYSVTERTHEIGIRMTLGAGQSDVLRLVMGKGLVLTGAGIVIGMAMSVGLAQLLASLIFGVSATDVTTFGGVALALATASLLACYIPARRASRVDPMIALRYE